MNMKFPSQTLNCANFIDGEFIKGLGAEFKIISPYNQKILGIGNYSTKDEINKAIESASIAQKEWAQVPIKERTKVMFNFRQILIRDLEEISYLKSSESGKCFEEGRAGL
jgi:malonate-semialdehyde dehydrogenase (acetylating)/methylmalonate-semialdehyde dehydrogenase